VAVSDVPEPTIQEPTDVIVRVTSAAICDVLGHEPMGYEIFQKKADRCIKVVLRP
jgi:threonine dehydrogenase-like Zn-dependent dehydrogenase